MSKITFDDFMILVDEDYIKYPELRFGQALMNRLYQVNQPMYDHIVKGSSIDCFYDTMKAEQTMEFLRTNWGK